MKLQDTKEEARVRLRQWARRALTVPARVEIFLDGQPRPFNSGTAMVRNLSLTGALLGRIILRKNALPASRFKIHIQFRVRGIEGIAAVARPVHFGTGKEFELGVSFDDFWIEEDA